jgi:hypothetical protein
MKMDKPNTKQEMIELMTPKKAKVSNPLYLGQKPRNGQHKVKNIPS